MEIYNLKDSIISFILSPPMEWKWLYNLRLAFIISSFLLLVGLIILLFKNTWLSRFIVEDWTEFLTWKAYGYRTAGKNWKKLKAKLKTGQESEYKLAIIEADKIMTDILKRMEYDTKVVPEILNRLPTSIYSNVEEVKWAHELHEGIVHDPDFRLSLDDAKRALEAYEKFLTEVEAA